MCCVGSYGGSNGSVALACGGIISEHNMKNNTNVIKHL